jgi:tRNA threonylcarbamoyladenosine biosynthesis protein TsaB
MIILAMDTATSATSVALSLPGGSVLSERDDPAPGAHPGHATRLLPMAASLLAETGLRWDDVERIAVGLGPGTFTGLRVGVATARGLAQSLRAPLVGFSSLAALAHAGLRGEAPPGRVLSVIDARRGEVFAAVYEMSPGGELVELVPARAVDPARLGEVLSDAGPEPGARRVLAIGDGAVRYREAIGAELADVPPKQSRLHLVDAAAGCELAASGDPADLAGVLPDYRRRPDAEIALSATGGPGR